VNACGNTLLALILIANPSVCVYFLIRVTGGVGDGNDALRRPFDSSHPGTHASGSEHWNHVLHHSEAGTTGRPEGRH